MVNKILGPVLVVASSISPIVASAQDTVKGIVCLVTETCDIEKSTLSYILDPGVNRPGTISDVDGSLVINLNCVGIDGINRTGNHKTVIRNGFGTTLSARLDDNNTFTPYKFTYPTADNLLPYGTDFDCELGDIEVLDKK